MAVGDVYKLRTVCYTSNQISVNVTHWESTAELGSISPGLLLAAAIGFEAILAPLYKVMMPAQASWRGCGFQRVKVAPTLEWASTTLDGLGTAMGSLVPTQSSGLISWRTADVTRRGRGRIYIGFPPTGSTDADGSPNASYMVPLAALGLAYVLPRTWTFGMTDSVSLKLVVVNGVVSVPTKDVITYAEKPRYATQRRRGQYGRLNLPPW